MDFSSMFLKALTDRPSLPEGVSPLLFAGRPFFRLKETEEDLLTILSGGTIEAGEPYSFSFHPFACRMLLYTRRGSGTLRQGGRAYALKEGTFLYLNCSSVPFQVAVSAPVWHYSVFFIRGTLLSCYESLVPFENALLLSPSPCSPILAGLERLLQAKSSVTLGDKLSEASILNDIITRLWLEGFSLEARMETCPSWLLEIRQSLDAFFMYPFRLDDLEKRYHISKYRICREFSAAFGMPPLKYVNKRRIEAARNLLLSGDKHIHEIASETGFENTNHFINLFKKETGLTPLVYRNKRGSGAT